MNKKKKKKLDSSLYLNLLRSFDHLRSNYIFLTLENIFTKLVCMMPGFNFMLKHYKFSVFAEMKAKLKYKNY